MSAKSSNAYKHGAQSEPQKSLILVHLKYILGFEAEAMDLLYPTPRIAAAMNLAACEARLYQVYTHYIKVQSRDRDPDFDRLMECAEDFLYFASPNASEVREALSRILKLEVCPHFLQIMKSALQIVTCARLGQSDIQLCENTWK